MASHLRAALVPGVLALALIGAGCGDSGTSSTEYLKEATAVSRNIERELGSIEMNDPDKLGANLSAAADVLAGAARDMDALDPPDDARALHDRFVAGIETLAADFKTAAKGADSTDPDKALEAVQALQDSDGFAQLDAASTELERLG